MAAAVCLTVPMANAADSLTMDKFAYTNKLMVAGYTGTETLQNFPVLVRLSETRIPGFLYANLTNEKGADIAFFDDHGNHLASEIETNSWKVGTAKDSQIWVKLPQMKQQTKFYMCYNTSASGAWVTNENPWGDYVGVWHLDETGGSGKTIYDSTANGMNGTTYAGSSNGSGAVGKARRIANDNSHAWGIVVDATNGVQKTAADSLGTDFHASFWMLAGAAEGNVKWGNIIGRRYGDQGYSWGFQFGGDNTAGTSVDYMRVHSDNDNSGNKYTSRPLGSWLKLNDGVWKKVDLVWKYATNNDTPYIDIYTNGVYFESMKTSPKVRLQDANIGIGCSTQPNPANADGKKGRRFNGSMDEVRLRPGVSHLLLDTTNPELNKSDWIKADFDTVNNENFVTIAPPDVLEVEWAEGSGRVGVTNIAMHAVVVGGVVSGFGPNTAFRMDGSWGGLCLVR